ncbi:hypothetical protein FPV16_14920 [Methylobacterium sp. W2]|uniref:hypothetical protein n=1 Tax=Methylobacterium sp. W2 TaxID=2598107 RepID=UPI001D0C819E|nr:hypothetical protein [Methylobacterium sp. W2]MCC0807506.1 hypothetical protein [Methylobacterium sp. W2]
MRWVLYGTLAFALATGSAAAKPWTEMTQAEGLAARAQVQPFVLAAYDCIAGAIPGSAKASEFARRKKWLEASAATSASCERSVQQMLRAIDVTFEPGEGIRYLHGAFRSELPKNLAQRVRLPERPVTRAQPVPPPAVAASNPEAEASKRKLLDAASIKHSACIEREMIGIVPYSSEGAETLANVIMSRCAHYEAEQVDVAVAAYGYSKNTAQAVIAPITAGTRGRLVERIVTARAEAAKAAHASPAADPPVRQRPDVRPAAEKL